MADYASFAGIPRVPTPVNDANKSYWMNRHEPLLRLESFNRGRIAAWGPALKSFARSLLRKDP